jgi:uridine phosphorylase
MNETRVLINPSRAEGEPRIARDAIMISITPELRAMAKQHNAERTPLRTLYPFEFFLIKKEGNLPLALAGPLLGAPQAAIVLEKLIALGAQRLWVLGWCGSLQDNLRIGDLVIPTTVRSEEGTTAHYPVDEKMRRSDPGLNEKLKDALHRANLSFTAGPVWTTDAIYRETRSKVAGYQSEGILAVDMEISALITVAAYRSVALAGILVVSDELSSLEWHPGFGHTKIKKSSAEAFAILLDLCLNYD